MLLFLNYYAFFFLFKDYKKKLSLSLTWVNVTGSYSINAKRKLCSASLFTLFTMHESVLFLLLWGIQSNQVAVKVPGTGLLPCFHWDGVKYDSHYALEVALYKAWK